MFSFLEILLVLLSVGLPLIVSVALVEKTGFNRWLGLLIVVPLANIGLVLYLLTTVWPVHRELAFRRLQAGEGKDKDGMIGYLEAIRLQKSGRHQEAIRIFRIIETSSVGSSLANDARISREELEKNTARSGSRE